MMPTVDLRNESMHLRIIEKFTDRCPPDLIESLRQTEQDRNFTRYFYNNITRLINKINILDGFVVGFNFAIFREDSDKSYLKNYAMFPEIKICFDNNHNKNLLGEWLFLNDNYSILLTNKILLTYSKYNTIPKAYTLEILNNYTYSFESNSDSEYESTHLHNITFTNTIDILRKTFYENIEDECKIEDNIIDCTLEYILNKFNIYNNEFKKSMLYIIQNMMDIIYVNQYILSLSWIIKLDLTEKEKIAYYYEVFMWTKDQIEDTFGKYSDVLNYDKINLEALSYMLNCEIGLSTIIYKHKLSESKYVILL